MNTEVINIKFNEFDWNKIIDLRKQKKIKSIRFADIKTGDRLLTFNGMFCNGILKVEKKNTTYDSEGRFTYEVIGEREAPRFENAGISEYSYDEHFEIIDDNITNYDIIRG